MKNNKLTECRDDIVAAIKSGWDGSVFRNINVSDVIDKHGAEAVQTVLAATIQLYNWDGRFSPDNKEWASGFSLFAKQTENIAITTAMSHPYITNGVTNMVRKEISEREKAAENELGYDVIFEGGQARDGISGCNYMLANCKDADGDNVELYAEYLAPAGLREDEVDAFDRESYPVLKEEILQQAKENGIDTNSLLFPNDEFDKSEVKDFEYKLDGDNAVITGYIGENKDVVIPSEIDGHTVTAIAGSLDNTATGKGAFENNDTITSVVIPDGVTSIGDTAFLNCTALESVSIPDSVKEIKGAAFLYCDSLKNVELPKDAKVSSAAFDKGAVVKRPPAKEEKAKKIKSKTAEKPSKSLTADNRKKRRTDMGIGD